jgi:hypothetical protein
MKVSHTSKWFTRTILIVKFKVKPTTSVLNIKKPSYRNTKMLLKSLENIEEMGIRLTTCQTFHLIIITELHVEFEGFRKADKFCFLACHCTLIVDIF